jgi:hypothetical protein
MLPGINKVFPFGTTFCKVTSEMNCKLMSMLRVPVLFSGAAAAKLTLPTVTLLTCIEKCPVSISTRSVTVLINVFCDFRPSLQANIL